MLSRGGGDPPRCASRTPPVAPMQPPWIPSFSHMVIVVVAASKLVHHPIGTEANAAPRVEAPLIWFCCSGSLNERPPSYNSCERSSPTQHRFHFTPDSRSTGTIPGCIAFRRILRGHSPSATSTRMSSHMPHNAPILGSMGGLLERRARSPGQTRHLQSGSGNAHREGGWGWAKGPH